MPHSRSRIRVLLADDQAMLLSALSTILTAQEDIEVAATAATGADAVAAALSHHIDVAILDIRMPGMDGIGAAQAILERKPECRIIMLTTFNDEELVARSISAGAHGFLLKDADPEVLVTAVRNVAQGESVLAAGVTGPVLEAYRSALTRENLSAQERQGLSLVTRREMEVLSLIARGATNAEIAADMVIAETTVKTHVSALMSKLAARDRVALVLLAQRAGVA
ncbi:DNA-binding response regulator [Corynebacterium sp. HMSC062E11]|uniref:response regulator n=1 Tax=Corynebacterium TaxID=1716 RepID=UPI0008A410A9|nr:MULTISPECIES: response regulator transcription factor [unclassified Corynebacterium]OFK29655.1 DNA-binding response regulator [Corynebacterium sp. HMSC062E11]OFL21090.1 DNA-binding response regulator [Corynebacterium sp. HMSC062A03]OFP71701.1 DNA-binding response regulator [Corynebacterium sp. HMSC078C09]OFQ34306.1 DNA-binding response regulator [Corynebacterium sp. HMSC072D12]OFQ95074.1 DNA-binding response regulator [Corynebacterium sp. HMSC056E09]